MAEEQSVLNQVLEDEKKQEQSQKRRNQRKRNHKRGLPRTLYWWGRNQQ